MINNTRINQYSYDITKGQDFMAKKHLIEGSSILSSNEFYYNWVHQEEFCDNNHDPTVDGGLDLSTELKYDVYIEKDTDVYRNYYMYAICQKTLTVGPTGITVG
jgi:hypothetical protein